MRGLVRRVRAIIDDSAIAGNVRGVLPATARLVDQCPEHIRAGEELSPTLELSAVALYSHV
jgi:hypothetical protein